MKLIYLHQYFRFPHEPHGTRSYDLASSFVNEGYEVEVLSLTSNPLYDTKQRWVSVEKDSLIVHYIYLPYGNHLSYLRRTWVFFQYLWFSTFKLLSIKCDLVLATSTPLTIGIPALIKKWLHKTPFIFETRDIWPEAVIAIGAINNKLIQKALYWLEKLIYQNASAIIPLSVDMKRSITLRYPRISKPIQVIENISEIKRFQKGFDKNKSILTEKIGNKPRFSILYAGSFGKVNGIEYVIDLADRIFSLDPGIVFILIGSGKEKQKIIDLAIEKDILNKNVYVLDPVAKQDLPQLYYEVNMGSSFVIPIKELWANSANKFFDTLAAGKPILINHEGWQKDVIEKEEVGFVLPAQIGETGIKNFLEYINDEELQQEQKKNALDLAKRRFSLGTAVEKYIHVFQLIFIETGKTKYKRNA